MFSLLLQKNKTMLRSTFYLGMKPAESAHMHLTSRNEVFGTACGGG
jgi:hypothetical protein